MTDERAKEDTVEDSPSTIERTERTERTEHVENEPADTGDDAGR